MFTWLLWVFVSLNATFAAEVVEDPAPPSSQIVTSSGPTLSAQTLTQVRQLHRVSKTGISLGIVGAGITLIGAALYGMPLVGLGVAAGAGVDAPILYSPFWSLGGAMALIGGGSLFLLGTGLTSITGFIAASRLQAAGVLESSVYGLVAVISLAVGLIVPIGIPVALVVGMIQHNKNARALEKYPVVLTPFQQNGARGLALSVAL